MKNILRNAAAVALCSLMLLSGCSGAQGDKEYAYPENYSRVAAVTDTKYTRTTGAGNSGDVKLESGDIYAVIKIKEYGDITVKLYPKEAPYAVQNFIDLALAGTYDGRTFHRIMENFMMQGGSADGVGGGGGSADGSDFRNEINTSLRHYYGAFCYGSALGLNSDQFYIVNNKNPQSDLAAYYNYYAAYDTALVDAYKEERDKYDPDTREYIFYERNRKFYEDGAEGAQAMGDTLTEAVIEKYKNGGTPALDGSYTVFGQTVDGFDVIDAVSAVEKTEYNGELARPAKTIVIESVKIYTKE